MKAAVICLAPLRSGAVAGGNYFSVFGEGMLDAGIDVELWTDRGSQPLTAMRVPVRRIWRPGIWAWLDLTRAVLRKKPDIVHFQHLFFLLGNGVAGEISTLMLLFCLRLFRSHFVVTLHDVPGKDQITSEYLRIHKYPYPVPLVVAALTTLFWATGFAANRLIVHDALSARRLVEFGVPQSKIRVVPHVPIPSRPIDRDEARTTLGLLPGVQAVLFFGYATGYKGIDNLLDAFDILERRGSRVCLLFGAGPHPKLDKQPDYHMYYAALKTRVQSMQNVRFIGFVDTDLLSTHIAAADVGILPYLEFHGASGPLFHYFSHDRPVLVSEAIGGHIDGLRDCVFKKNPESMAAKIIAYFESDEIREKISREWADARTFAFSGDYVHLTQSVYKEVI